MSQKRSPSNWVKFSVWLCSIIVHKLPALNVVTCLCVAVLCFRCMNSCTWQFFVSGAWIPVRGSSLFQVHEFQYVAVLCFRSMNSCTWQFFVSDAWLLVHGRSLFQIHELLYMTVCCFSCMNACTWQFAVSAAWMLVLGSLLFQLHECLKWQFAVSAAWMLICDVTLFQLYAWLNLAMHCFSCMDACTWYYVSPATLMLLHGNTLCQFGGCLCETVVSATWMLMWDVVMLMHGSVLHQASRWLCVVSHLLL
jgi:hypothetical protein